jgi:hypothetical protein
VEAICCLSAKDLMSSQDSGYRLIACSYNVRFGPTTDIGK